MKFEVNHFYAHSAGRHIAVLGTVNSYKWGKMLVIEEADPTGHSISCSEIGQEANDNNWVEIGKGEWLQEFPEEYQQRVVVEKDDLDMKIGKLAEFLAKDAFSSLKAAEQTRMQRQLEKMRDYSTILGERIAAFGAEKEPEKVGGKA